MNYFDEEWLVAASAALAGLDAVDGADLVVDYVVSGAPDGKTTIAVRFVDGRVESVGLGRSTDVEVTISLSFDTAVAVLESRLSTDAAFMNGSLKVEGDYPSWLLGLRDARTAALAALAPVVDATRA